MRLRYRATNAEPGGLRLAGRNWKIALYFAAVTLLIAYGLYNYHRAQPLDEERIEHCNELVSGMPEATEEEINQSINTFVDCLKQ
jgi:hypothetical protein